MVSGEIIASLILSENFGRTLEEIIKKELRMSIREFSDLADVPPGTIYKLISGEREPNLKTLRKIAKTIERLLKKENEMNFIAVIASRSVLNQLMDYEIELEGGRMAVREYPANSFDEAVISALRAEKEGARAVVCAPILSPLLEKILNIPIATIVPRDDLLKAIKIAAKKVMK